MSPEMLKKGVRLAPNDEKPSEPGPRGGVGEGRIVDLRSADLRSEDWELHLHALRPEASADLLLLLLQGPTATITATTTTTGPDCYYYCL